MGVRTEIPLAGWRASVPGVQVGGRQEGKAKRCQCPSRRLLWLGCCSHVCSALRWCTFRQQVPSCPVGPWGPPQHHLLVKHSCARGRGHEHQSGRDQKSQGDTRGQWAAGPTLQRAPGKARTEGEPLGACSGGGAIGSAGREGGLPSSGPLGKGCVSEWGGVGLGCSQGPAFLGPQPDFLSSQALPSAFSSSPPCLPASFLLSPMQFPP